MPPKSDDADDKRDPEGSGSVEVSVSDASLRVAQSGSVEVQVSDPSLPIPRTLSDADSAPVSSGKVHAVANEPHSGAHRAREALTAAASGGVELLGEGIAMLGEGVTKLGDLTNKVPLVGASIGKLGGRLGEGLTRAGESVHALPAATKTRRGRLLVRSVLVAFVLVAGWIAAIVGLQLHGNDVPDFRPSAEAILSAIGKGSASIGEVYEKSSPRFQEMVRKERFIDEMTDLTTTLGKFNEVTAINDTLVTSGPAGRVGRVSLTASYARGICKGSISFHRDQGRWKLLGIGLELPPDLKVTQAQREQRVAACKDPDNRKTCDVRDAAETILEQLRDGKAGEVWDAASPVFRTAETRIQFATVQDQHREALGAYKRILRVTEAKVIGGTSATFDTVSEFERSSGVRTVFGFERQSKTAPWQLRSFKLVLPMPRADEGALPTNK
ncbi:MAG: hypothetical protein ABI467_01295 [Kofleriaceae bacterium]